MSARRVRCTAGEYPAPQFRPCRQVRPAARLGRCLPGRASSPAAGGALSQVLLSTPGDPRRDLARRKRAADPRIERRSVGIAAVRSPRDLSPAAKTWIDELARPKCVKGSGIIARVFALPARRRFEAKAEPGEIVCNRRFVGRLATSAIQVFNAQQQAAV